MKEFILKLYISGETEISRRAIITAQELCDQYLTDNYELEIIDVWLFPQYAEAENITTTPVLIRYEPGRMRRFVGDNINQAVIEFIKQNTALTYSDRDLLQTNQRIDDYRSRYNQRINRNLNPQRRAIIFEPGAKTKSKMICRDYIIHSSIESSTGLFKKWRI